MIDLLLFLFIRFHDFMFVMSDFIQLDDTAPVCERV